MFDWINGLFTDVDNTIHTGVSVVAVIWFLVNSHRGNWAATRIVISAVMSAVVIAVVWNINLFAKKAETDFKSGAPSVVVTVAPPSSTLVHI